MYQKPGKTAEKEQKTASKRKDTHPPPAGAVRSESGMKAENRKSPEISPKSARITPKTGKKSRGKMSHVKQNPARNYANLSTKVDGKQRKTDTFKNQNTPKNFTAKQWLKPLFLSIATI